MGSFQTRCHGKTFIVRQEKLFHATAFSQPNHFSSFSPPTNHPNPTFFYTPLHAMGAWNNFS